MRLGFGLCFSAGNPQPENVFCLVHPLPEPGVRGEEGAALSAAELLATLERGELQAGRDFDPKYVKTIIEKRSKELRTGLVVSAEAEGRLQSADRRAELLQYLQDEFELRTFFHQRAYETMPRWAKEMQDTLLHALGPIFAISRENVKTKEESMSEREPERSAPPAFTHLTMNFNASVGTVAQANAPGAQAAARDIVIGSPLADLPQAFAAVQKAIDDGSSPHEGEQRRSMSSQLSEVREVLQSEARSTDDGHRVKSCLDGLEKTAKAVTNAQAVHKALAPIWEGAKYYWPTLF